MGNNLTMQAGAVPAHILAAFGGAQANEDLKGGVSIGYPIVSYKGKTWHVVTGDDRQLITMDGSEHPAPFISGVLIRANPKLNKTYYPNGYEEGSTEKPLCHSNDSIAPAMDAQEPQAAKCAVCLHNQWGSKITENGARGKACSDARRLAIAPDGDLENVMLLRVPAASLKNLLTYSQQLDKRGVPYQALVTEIAFDHSVAYPQLTFKPQRWLDAEEVAQVQALYDSDLVRAITAIDVPSIEEAPAQAPVDDFLPPGGPAQSQATPQAQTRARAGTRQATPAEVNSALQGAQQTEAPKRTTGFGGAGKKPAAQPVQTTAAEPAEQASQAQVVAEGAMAELDAVLGEFDDA